MSKDDAIKQNPLKVWVLISEMSLLGIRRGNVFIHMDTSHDLSDQQRLVLAFVEGYIKEFHRPPTMREISIRLHIPSLKRVNYLLRVLMKKDYIALERTTSRGIRVLISVLDVSSEAAPTSDEGMTE